MEYPENACIKPPGRFLRPLEAFYVLVPVKSQIVKRREWKAVDLKRRGLIWLITHESLYPC
jgi:hypothetical protein